MNLERWAERQFKVVEADGVLAARVRLICVNDQSCLEIWEAPFDEPGKWAQEAEGLVDQWLNDMPAKPISLLFVAEDKAGGQRSSCPMNVRGKNREASNDLLKGRDVKALADSMEAQARTMDRILGTANAQLDRMNTTLDTVTKAHGETLDYLRAKHTNEALQAQEAITTNGQIMGMVEKFGGPLIDILGAHFKASPMAKDVAKAAASAVASAAAADQAPPRPQDQPQQPDPNSIPTEGQTKP